MFHFFKVFLKFFLLFFHFFSLFFSKITCFFVKNSVCNFCFTYFQIVSNRYFYAVFSVRLSKRKKRAAQKIDFMLSVGLRALFHFLFLFFSHNPNRAAHFFDFMLSVGLRALFHFFQNRVQ